MFGVNAAALQQKTVLLSQQELNQICQHSKSVTALCVLVLFHLFSPGHFIESTSVAGEEQLKLI